MTKRVRLNVTPADIERGVRCDGRICVAAEALKRENPHFVNVKCDIVGIRFTDSRTRMRYRGMTPLAAIKFIQDFDAGVPLTELQPFSCTVECLGRAMDKPGRKRAPSSKPQDRTPRVHYRTGYLRKHGLCQLAATVS